MSGVEQGGANADFGERLGGCFQGLRLNNLPRCHAHLEKRWSVLLPGREQSAVIVGSTQNVRHACLCPPELVDAVH